MGDRIRLRCGSSGRCVFFVSWAFLLGGLPSAGAAMVVGFEDLPLKPESFYNGSDGAGGFVSGGAFFNNTFPGGGYWSGWSYSNVTDTTTPGWENQYSAITGGGAGGSNNYAVAFSFTPGEAYLELAPGTSPLSVRITNTTYAYHSIRDGDSFTDPFGGPGGDEPDYFLLTITGLGEGGDPLGSVDFYLADYRFEDNSLDFLVDTWTEIDLSRLDGATTLSFGLQSSDVGPYGMNTPAYFAIDNLRIVPEPTTLGLFTVASLVLLRRRSRRAVLRAIRGVKPARRSGVRVLRGEYSALVILWFTVVTAGTRTCGQTPFASEVIDYAPAPGQFVRDENFNDEFAALGPPVAGGFSEPGVSSLVTLGGFGGSITLRFDTTVEDHPLNPLGMDAIVFTNAFWLGSDPNVHWAECATIEISLDVNGNGRPDERPEEPWYLIPGSHIPDPTGRLTAVTWDDNIADDTYPPEFASWLPPDRSGLWTTQAYALPDDPFGSPVVRNPSDDPDREGIFGYAEYTPTLRLGDLDGDNVVDDPDISPEDFYTVPDDPLRVGITPGSGGGDAFDIAWAIDPVTGDPSGLTGFDFIRLTSAVSAVSELMGEKSPEIDAVADVAPDPLSDFDDDGDIDLVDAAALQNCFALSGRLDMGCGRFDRDDDGVVALEDAAACADRMTGPL